MYKDLLLEIQIENSKSYVEPNRLYIFSNSKYHSHHKNYMIKSWQLPNR